MILLGARVVVAISIALAPGLPPILPPSPATTPSPPVLPPAAADANACAPRRDDRCCDAELPTVRMDSLAEAYRLALEGADDEASALRSARGYFRCVYRALRGTTDLDERLRRVAEAMALPLAPTIAIDPAIALTRRGILGEGVVRAQRAALELLARARRSERRRDPGAAIRAYLDLADLLGRMAAIYGEGPRADASRRSAAEALHSAFLVGVEHSATWAVCPTIRASELASPRLDLDRALCDPPPPSPRGRAALRARIEGTPGSDRDRQAWSRSLRLYHPQDLAGIAAGALSLASVAGALSLRSRYHGNCYQPGGPPRCADDPDIPARDAWAGGVVLSVLAGALAITSAAFLAERRLRRRSSRCAPIFAGSGRALDGAITCRF